MEVSLVVAAVIFTLLAIVVATSMFTGTSPSSDYGRRAADGAAEKESASPATQNGHVPCSSPDRDPSKPAECDRGENSGSSHDHGDVVKNVQSEEELSTDPSRPRGSYLNLSDSELLKCAFPVPPTEGAAESADHSDPVEPDSSFRYLPGKSRSHHLQKMMSKDELEEEQRVQREQLAAIFQLLKNNQETFGEVSQNDMEEQLRLYSI